MKIISINTLDPVAATFNKQASIQSPINFTPLETRLAEIWQEILGVAPTTPEVNFFELGGNSLTASQVVARIRSMFEVNFPLQDFFVAPSLAEIAVKLDLLTQQQSLFIMPAIVPVSRDQALPLSFSQERMWFVHHLDQASTAYNVVGALRLQGKFDQAAMQQSLNQLIARHESLRTTFPAIEGRPIQRIASNLEITITTYDLNQWPEGEQETKIEQILTSEASSPFDIESGPLLRVALLKVGAQENIMLLNMHHLITDGWSMTVFGQELLEIYKGLVSGITVNLPPLQLQFADYAYWQRQWLQGEVLEAHLNYWRRQLTDVTPLNLPTDHPRPAIQTYRGSFVAAPLQEDLLEGLRRFANMSGATPFMVELAAFQVLLYRYTGQTDLVVGTPVANREWIQSESLIGSLVTTLPLRANLTGQPTFREFLRQVRQTALDAYTYQNIPFTRLVANINPTRDTSYSPLTQVIFNVINVPMPSYELPEVKIEQIEVDRLGAQFDLSFNIVDMPTVRSIRVEYNADLFERSTIQGILEHYLELLRVIILDPDQSVDTISILSAAEKHLLLKERNATGQTFDQNQTLVQAFETQVECTPQALALLSGDITYTYAQLNVQINQLAHYLIEKGIKPTARIGLCLYRSYDSVVAILATLKAGGTYVALDPAYPLNRLEYMVQDADLSMVITSGETAGLARKVCQDTIPVIDLAAENEEIINQSSENLEGLTNPSVPAYVSYTSGSTGQPKGVIGTQYGVLNRAAWMWRTYPFEGGEVLCHKTSLNFVDSVWEIFGPLLQGVPTVILPDVIVKDPDALVKALAQYRVSRITLVPSLLRTLLETHPNLGKKLPDLRLVVSSGEVLPAALAHQFLAQLTQTRLLNLYGSSEASADSTYYEVDKNSPADFIPLGKPMDNVQLYVLDTRLQLVPSGVPGELYIGGMGLALGYLNRPELTAARFISNPFISGERLFQTGDWVRYLPDGNLQFLGRQDDQVKIRGMRVSIGEVEERLKKHPAVAAAVVIVREDQSGNSQLAGFVVPRKGIQVEVQEIRAFLATHLPGHLIPSRLESLPQFPLTPNGKLDKIALNALLSSTKAEQVQKAEPQDKLEFQLLAIWRRLLEYPEIGMTDDFFALGGHSLLAVRLFAEIEKEFGVKLPLASLFQTPTPAGLARSIRDWNKGTSLTSAMKSSPLIPIQAKGSKPPFFCVHGIGGGVIRYAHLASNLGLDQPFYGLDALSGGPEEDTYASVEAIAKYYIEAIQTIQPVGPYHLGGYSFGGTVAYEMACQLTSMGHSIGLLAVFDHPAPNGGYEIPRLNLTFFRGLVKNLPHWWKDFMGFQTKGRLGRIWRKIEAYTHARRNKGHITVDYFEKDISRAPGEFQELIAQLYKTALKYEPRPYSGRVAVFRAPRQPLICSYDPHLAWDKLAMGGVDVYQVAGDHHNLLEEPHVKVMAAALRTALKDKPC